jgi:hypothetical protein
MVSPITMVSEGGFFMYVLLLVGLVHAATLIVQAVRVKKLNLIPLLWALMICTFLIGCLGSVMGLVMCFQAVARAAPEMKQTLLASGISVAMYTTAGGLIVAILQAFLNGIIASVVSTVNKSDSSAPE